MIKKVFPILALCMFSSTLGMGIISPLLPLYVEGMGATGIWLGIIVAAYFISNGVVLPIVGRLSDRRGRKLFLTIGLLAYSIISLGYIGAANVYQLALVRLIHGVGGAMTLPVALAYVGDLSPEGEEGRWMGFSNAAFFGGFALGPLMGGVLSEHFGMTAAFSAMGGLNLLAFLIAVLFLPEVSSRKTREASHLSFKEMSSSNMVKGLFSFRLGHAVVLGALISFLPIFAAMIGLSISLIGTLVTINVLSVTLFTPLGGIIADRFSKRTLIILGGSLFAILLAAVPLTNSFGLLVAVMFIHGLAAAISIPAAAALVVEEGRKYGMGSTMAILTVAMSIGMATGPILGGVIADFANISSVFYFGAVMGLIGAILFAWFSR